MNEPRFSDNPAADITYLGQTAMRLLAFVHAYAQDIDGAVEATQPQMAAMAARAIVVETLGIHAMWHGGMVVWSPEEVSFDMFDHCPSHIADLGRRVLALSATAFAGTIPTELTVAVGELVASTEALLGLTTDLPQLRTADGMYQAMGLARGIIQATVDLDLAPVLPPDWTPDDPGAAT